MRRIFSTVRRPQDPALTVESLAMSATRRPPILPRPVITPSAGSSGSSALARVPSSRKLPSSSSRRTRSRANSLPLSAFFWWYLGAPPFSIRLSSSLIFASKDNSTSGGRLLADGAVGGKRASVLLLAPCVHRACYGSILRYHRPRNAEGQAADETRGRRRGRHREADADGETAAVARHPAQRRLHHHGVRHRGPGLGLQQDAGRGDRPHVGGAPPWRLRRGRVHSRGRGNQDRSRGGDGERGGVPLPRHDGAGRVALG